MSSGPAPKVCVLGEEERAFLAVIRSFGRRGAEVHAAWASPASLARRSRYVARFHDDLPHPSADPSGWLEPFARRMERERFDLVIPTNDATVVPLQRERARLTPVGRIALVSDEAFATLFDKARTHALAASLGIRVPRQVELTPGDTDASIDPSWYPVVLKARASLAPGARRRSTVVHVGGPSELAAALARLAATDPPLAQAFFAGEGVGVEVLAHDGRILTALQHARVHERRIDGADSYRRTEALDPVLLGAAARMVEALRYTGVAMVEFRRDPVRDDWVLLEVNARFWGSLPLCLRAGADFPYWLYQMLVEGRREFPRAYAVGVACRNWSRDLVWVREALADAATRRTLPRRLLGELAVLLRGREASDTLVLDDPGPGREELRRLIAAARVRGRRAGRAWLDRWPPTRRRRAAAARRAIGRARHVLFVCKGNVCRSPFAAAYARRAWGADGPVVTSAGYHPAVGRPSPPQARAVAREYDVDLTAHRSCGLEADMVEAADAVVTFDAENYETVLARFPQARPRTYRLALLDDDGAVEIDDPWAGSLDDFRAVYRLVSRILDGVRR